MSRRAIWDDTFNSLLSLNSLPLRTGEQRNLPALYQVRSTENTNNSSDNLPMSTVEDFSVTEVEGDLFDAPDGSALIRKDIP